jgi:hypothetical protein
VGWTLLAKDRVRLWSPDETLDSARSVAQAVIIIIIIIYLTAIGL